MLRNVMTFLLLSFSIGGCAGATFGPGAGTVQGMVKGTVVEVDQRVQTVFQQMKIQLTGNSMKNSGNERELTGMIGDTEVTVTMNNASNSTTTVEVQASKNIVDGKRDFAREVLNRIVQQG